MGFLGKEWEGLKKVGSISLSLESAVSASFQENKGRSGETGNAGIEQTRWDLDPIIDDLFVGLPLNFEIGK